jgi:error-prone DNA polymerase
MSNVHHLPAAQDQKRAEASDAPAPAYAELAVTTNFSFLRGASHPHELVKRAKILGLNGIGIADRNSVAGVVRVHVVAKDLNETIRALNKEHGTNISELKIAVGARLVFDDGATPDILAYPQDRVAWGRLTRLLSVGKLRGNKGECLLGLPDLLDFIAGLNLIVMPPPRIDASKMRILLARLKNAASENSVWLAASMLYRGDDTRRIKRLMDISNAAFIPLIAVNDVLYHAARRRALQDIVTCIREHATMSKAGRLLEANAERHLKPPKEMTRLFRNVPEAIKQTTKFIDQCSFSLEELKKTEYHDETRQGFATPQDALIAFAQAGAHERFPEGIPSKIQKGLGEELKLIGEKNYAPFFLTVHSIVRHARSLSPKILCQGRGSAANSTVCYCLGITEVDPNENELLFTRFISNARDEPPDIDVDFEHERREEVIQHIYNTYGREQAGLAATVICYRGRSAIREVGKVFELSEDTIALLASSLWGWSMEGVTGQHARRGGLDPSDRRLKMARSFARLLMGFPRHLSQHVGGFVITRNRLDEVVPIENAAMEKRTVIEWDKDDLDALALLKVDVLGLGMLSCLRRAFDLMNKHYKLNYGIPMLPKEEEAVYDMISRADTIGVFQVESRAQMSMLPRLKPRKFYDLVIEVAIVRPGPIQGNMVHPYLKRRLGLEQVDYQSKDLEDVLKRTLGVPLFQEQAIRIATVAAGFSPAEADELRRSMASFRRTGKIEYFKAKFINGMMERKYPREFANRCFSQIEGFAEYGFPESHAASFAILVYASAWLKCRYPDVFAAALLNSQPMGFYASAQLVRDAQEHGVEVRPVDVNLSDWDCSLEPLDVFSADSDGSQTYTQPQLHPRHAEMKDDIRTTHALRLGLRQISGFSEADGKTIESVRGKGFDSIRDLWLRTRLKPSALERLAEADAFRSLGLDRRDALWAVRALQRSGDKDDLPLFARVTMSEIEPDVPLPPMRLGEHVVEDYRHLHLSLKAHPVSFLRSALDARGIVRHEQLAAMASGRRVTVAGLVLVRQRPGTAKGVIFMTLEDETAIANTIVWQRVFETYRPVVLGARLISVTGKLQNASGVIHVVAEHMEDLSPLLRRLSEDTALVETTARADAVKRPVLERHRHPRAGDALVLSLKDKPALPDTFGHADHPAAVMPKGRNFH